MILYYYTSLVSADIIELAAKRADLITYEQLGVTSGEVQSRSLISPSVNFKFKVAITVHENDSSYRYRAIMEKTQLVLKFSLPQYIEFPVGTWCEWMNQTFYLGCPANFKKNGPRNFEYTLNMGTLENGMADYKLHNTVDGRLKWSMCAKPHEFIEEIVKNLNERDGDGVWSVGECIDATEKTVEFNHTYIDAALQSVADAFGTEYEISEDLAISLHKVEYFKDDPLALSYGRGNGFVPGVGRTSQTDEKPIKRLYVEGSDRNIDRSTYGYAELRLPKSKTLKYDGYHYEGEDGFDGDNAHTYTSDAEGTCIWRSDKISQAVKEDSLDCSEIYPSRVGVVSSVVAVDADKNFYDIIDNTIPADLDFSSYIIPGETMTIIFQSGMLAGKEFEVTYYHEAKTVNGVAKAARRFEIVPQEIDGVMMPNETYLPVAGNQYAVFGIQLPDAYICNDEDKSGASWDMFREAARHLYEHEEQKFTFTGELQGLWAKRNWMAIGGKLKVGGYVLFTDEHFAVDGTLIRITGIKDYLTAPYAPTIEISNSISGSSSTSQNLRTIEQTEVVINDAENRMKQFTKRRFRDAKETIEMLEEAMLDNFDNSISPIAVQTMAMLVGDESLQFQFVEPYETTDGETKYTRVDDTIEYDQDNKRLHIDHCYIEHLTLGINTIKASRDDEEYKHWEMEEYESPVLTETDKRYYLYAAVNKYVGHGSFVLSSKAIPFEGGSGSNGDVTVYPYNYYLLVGVLNSEYNEERSFASLYGFTEILPGRITTEKIVSSDGESYLDLVNSIFKLGDVLDFNNEEKDTLVLNNAKIKNALKVLEEALLAGFYFSDERIRSSMMSGNDYALLLDGKSGRIKLVSPYTGGTYSMSSGKASTIDINASQGVVETRNDDGVAYMSASGIFCNNAQTNALPSSSGYTHYGAIVGLGFGNVDYSWVFGKDSTIIAGVYGRASNSGTAPAYGGYFQNLCAAGLIYNQKYISDSAATTAVTLGANITQVVGLTNSGNRGLVYLPTDGYEGKVIYAKQIGAGSMRFYPTSGQKIFDDTSSNDYYDVANGYECKFTFSVYNLNGERVEVWLVSRWKF